MSDVPQEPKKINVLIVDDEDYMRRFYKKILGMTQLPIDRVDEAANGQEAVAILGARPADLIISDVDMPEMNGIKLLKHIKATPALQKACVIMLSGYPADDVNGDRRTLLVDKLGANEFFVKPVSMVQLVQTIDKIMNAHETSLPERPNDKPGPGGPGRDPA